MFDEVKEVVVAQPKEEAPSTVDTQTLMEVVSQYTKLNPFGTAYVVGVCPFHNSRLRNQTFMINLHKKSYHCRECGKHGDISAFQKAEKNNELTNTQKN